MYAAAMHAMPTVLGTLEVYLTAVQALSPSHGSLSGWLIVGVVQHGVVSAAVVAGLISFL